MKIKNKLERNLAVYLFIALLMLLILTAIIKFKPENYSIPALSLENFVQVSKVEVQNKNILLTSGCYRLLMITTSEQAESLSKALQNLTSARPDTHDIFAYSIKNFGISLLFVKIHLLRQGTYYATIFLKQGQNILGLDAKPSDAIAIALRVNAPVYLNKELLMYAEREC